MAAVIDDVELGRRVAAALERRGGLLADRDCEAMRLIHGAADGLPGLVVEQLGEVLIFQVHEQQGAWGEEQLRLVATQLMEACGSRCAYRKHFTRDRAVASHLDEHTRATPWLGEPAPEAFLVREDGRAWEVRPYDGVATGLFLDHRNHRRLVSEWCATASATGTPLRVLNLFAYTCTLSVCSAASGAAETVSVDLSKRYLEWGKRNFACNATSLEGAWFICSDVFDYFKRAERQERFFDLVLLDPPTFSRTRRPARTFVLAEQLDALVAGAVSRLTATGRLLLAVNHRGTTSAVLRDAVEGACREQGRSIVDVFEPAAAPGFEGDAAFAKSVVVRTAL